MSAKPMFGFYTIALLIVLIVVVLSRIVAQPWIDFSYAAYYSTTGYARGDVYPLLMLALIVSIIAFFVFIFMEKLGLYAFDKDFRQMFIEGV